MNLMDLPINRWGEVKSVDGDDWICRRLLELGFTPGECIRKVASSPLKDPIVVNIRGTAYALRSGEAACVKICLID